MHIGLMAGAALLGGGLVLAPSASADVSPDVACSFYHHNADAGSGTVTASSLARREGPYTYCDAYGYAAGGAKIYYWCYDYGSSVTGNGITMDTWTYGRISGTSQEGWFSDVYLSNHGATHQC
ncbi:SH3 domain-containing protein [Actinacidiphila bryophytorum]|nr:SH3 domain-containing protein [Actinacidiphila bryophytorum]MBM9438831.1 SH3 domain-containing protein [Actinacidiphila bryophytorum]